MARQPRRFNDGYIEGILERAPSPCANCDKVVHCIGIEAIHLPNGLESGRTLIPFKQDRRSTTPGYKRVTRLGIQCGCYAKAQRQIAHIEQRRKSAR
jgi:hypothetical protein